MPATPVLGLFELCFEFRIAAKTVAPSKAVLAPLWFSPLHGRQSFFDRGFHTWIAVRALRFRNLVPAAPVLSLFELCFELRITAKAVALFKAMLAPVGGA